MIARVVLGIIGVLLLLPGVCSVIFMGTFGSNGAGPLWLLWLGTFAVAWGGFVLLRKAWRG
ncbi:hypothetical protein [Oricola sp.]|uniref:hypothetical protein n=1 Tax=Oricola sp. TaxID=1979950 RepID=UPI000C8E0CAD|nr:hypothetical protein [Ahrensia sp.]MCK5749578.1 hypothetical protein [Oricola sp.]|tara:strand:- start:10891 stop:11073 length:183 start_codon:yes stop_codon:yes gene_type:complete